jgi:hypothetical protein
MAGLLSGLQRSQQVRVSGLSRYPVVLRASSEEPQGGNLLGSRSSTGWVETDSNQFPTNSSISC